MMFVGDKGKILAGFLVENPHLIPASKMRGYRMPPAPERPSGDHVQPGVLQWVEACRVVRRPPEVF